MVATFKSPALRWWRYLSFDDGTYEGTQMRLWSICSVIIVLACVNLASSIAAVRNANHDHHRHWRHHRLHETSQVFATCTCSFGYGDVCSVVVSCFSEGGRCSGSGSCVLKPQSEHLTFPKMPSRAAGTELARKCEAQTAKTYPLRVPGNPAAGAKGTERVRADYFNKCVRNGGRIDHQSDN